MQSPNPTSAAQGAASGAASSAESIGEPLVDQARAAAARLRELADRQKAAGANTVGDIAQAAEHVADDLDERMPQLSEIMRSVARQIEQLANDIRDRDFGNLFEGAQNFARRQPVVFLGGAVLTGIVLSRLVRSQARGSSGA
jgi:hypothetical protein